VDAVDLVDGRPLIQKTFPTSTQSTASTMSTQSTRRPIAQSLLTSRLAIARNSPTVHQLHNQNVL
jgi:hypothetical protein